MITIIATKGRYYPRCICDICGEPIDKSDNGIVSWLDGPGKAIRITHKGKCDKLNGNPHPWLELSRFMYNLSYNSPKDSEEVAKIWGECGL